MKFYILHIILFVCGLTQLFSQKISLDPQLTNPQEHYCAGDTIVLTFKTTKTTTNLYISNSYGNTVLKPIVHTSNTISYHFPSFISEKTGWIDWSLTEDLKNHKGKFYIHPKKKVSKIETYIGPPSLEAGYDDYAMLVAIPLDTFNNPLEKGTPITLEKSFLNQQDLKNIYFNGMIAYDLVDTKTKSGRLFMCVTCKNKTSKELSLEIYPNVPTNFKIKTHTVHNYADGNQLVKFTTSIIKDKYNNIVTNGSLVNFIVKNNNGNYFQTFGTTIHGIASAQLMHPDHAQTWNIQGFVDNISKSKKIALTFKSAVSNFEVNYNAIKKEINIGPFKSFMNQFIPDGLAVTIFIYRDTVLLKKINTQTEKGFAKIAIGNYIETSKKYIIKVTAANITKEITIYVSYPSI